MSFDSVPDASPCDLRIYRRHSVCSCTRADLDCGAHGACRILQDGAKPSCYCFYGYTGERCTECPPGHVITDRGCETLCSVAGLNCCAAFAGLKCFDIGCATDGTAHCDCSPGFEGDSCDRCAPEFHEEFLVPPFDVPPVKLCTPVCGACGADERCAPTTPPSCACRSAYTLTDGMCAYRGNDLVLPISTEQCGTFRFYAELFDSPAPVAVGARDGELFLRAPRCHLASSVTIVNFPAAPTLSNPALRIRFMGTRGVKFNVQFGGNPESYRDDEWLGGETLEATGLEQTAVICLSDAVAGERATLKLWFKDSDACNDELVEVDVREAGFVSSDTCAPWRDAGGE